MRRVFALAGTLLLIASGGSLAARAEPGDPAPSANVPDNSIVALDELRAVADPVAALYKEPGYGKVSIDKATRTVTVYWKGDPPATVASRLGRQKNGITLALVKVKFSEAELLGWSHALYESGVVPVDQLHMVKLEQDLSGLVAYLDNALAGASSRTTDQFAAAVPVPVRFTYGGGELVAVEQTRRDDNWPWQGAGQMNGGSCTLGFTALTSSGQGRILTAAHCDPTGNANVNDGAGQRISDGGAQVDIAPAQDSLLIDPNNPPPGSSSTIGKVFGGPWNANSGHNRYQFNVGGAGPPVQFDEVCVSGSNSGERCNRTINDVSVTRACFGGTETCTGFIYSGTGHTTAGGDSGAPVYVMRGDGRVGARGIHIQGWNDIPCSTPTHFPNSDCTRIAYAIGIHRILDRWDGVGLSIETNG